MRFQCVFVLVLLLSVTGCNANAANQPDDRMVNIGTLRLHIYCAGQGSPTVVMDTSFGDTSDKLRPIQERIAQETRVCVYDRAGYGLSEPGPLPRHSRQIASELKLLLEKAGIPGPYVLVGHSLGGLNAQVFASQYPKLVAGMVLIEPPPLRFVLGQQFPDLYQRAKQEAPNMLAMAEQARKASRLKEASFLETLASEHEMMLSETAQQLLAIESFGNVPLIVMGAGQLQPAFGDQAQAFQQFWIEQSQALASKSTRGAFVLVQESGHYIYLDAPDVVLDVIRQIAERVKGQQGGAEMIIKDQWTGSVEQKLWGLMTIWSEAKFNFPYFDRIPDIDWDKKAQEYIPRVIIVDSLDGYYEILMEFAALLKDGHTAVIPPWMFVKPGHDHPPVELQVVEDKFVVARTADTEEIKKQRLVPGLEVLEIGEHVPVRTYLKENVLRLNSRGTPQADEAIALIGILSGPKDSQVLLKVKDPDGTVREVSLTRNSKDTNGTAFQWRWVRWYMIDPVIETRMIQSDISYIKISNFGSEKVVEEFQKALDRLDLAGIQGIILDVRYNPGGNSTHAYSIASFLTDQPLKAAKWKSLLYVPAHRSWGRTIEWIEGGPSIIEPREGKRYSGPLVVLTGPGTFSAAEDFLVPLQYSRRAVLVGEKTAGSTGNPISVPLPGGGMFMVVSKRDMFPDGREFVGIGISPDVSVHPTLQDLLKGTEPVLQKGIDAIRNWALYHKKEHPA